MRKAVADWVLVAVLAGLMPVAGAQQKPAAASSSHAIPRPDELEPGVDTSAEDHDAAPPPAAHRTERARAARRSTRTRTARAQKGKGKAEDHLTLDTTDITGNRELPKVMYIVPWKHADLGDLGGKPMNSLVDEVLEPIDRDVFRRQTRYYDALKPDAPQASGSMAQPPAASGH